MKHIIDQIAARERQKEEKRVLQSAADRYNKKVAVQKALCAISENLSESERRAVEEAIANMDASKL
jgi:hypothetical protein